MERDVLLMTRRVFPHVALACVLVIVGCSSDQPTHIEIDLGDGGGGPVASGGVPSAGGSPAGKGGTAGSVSGAGGSKAGAGGVIAAGGTAGAVSGAGSVMAMAGVAGMGGSAIASAGSSGAAGAGGAGGAGPRCNNCWLLADNVQWERFDAFLSDGTQLVWQDYSDNVVTMGFDGGSMKSLKLPTCSYPWKNALLFDGYVYFSELHAASTYGIFRIRAGVAEGATCEQKYSGADNALSVFLDAPRNTFWVGSGTASTNAVTRILRVDYPSFAVRTEIAQADAYFTAADDAALYGYSKYHVIRYDRTTRAIVDLNDEVASSRVLAVDGTHAYYMSGANLKRTPKTTHTAGEGEIVPGPNQPWRIGVDGDRVVYWTLGDTHFYSMALAGGAPADVSLGTFEIRGLTWDATRWFVMTGPLDGPYKLLRIPK